MKAVVGKHTFELSKKDRTFVINGKEEILDILKLEADHLHVIRNGRSYSVEIVERNGKNILLKVNGKTCDVLLTDHMDELLKKLGMESKAGSSVENLKAPMPGLVVSVRVEKGAEVKKGDSLLVLEAMKMENVLKSHGDARVKSIRVKQGEAVEKGQVLVEFES
jgi:acetyl/propionyl-CoA carboxylase alpha subunit